VGIFTVLPRNYKYRYKFKIICKSCAYRISDIVIEGDGEEIKIKRKELK